MTDRRDRARELLMLLGLQVLDSIERGEFPVLHIPDRRTSNIVYDPSRGRFVLGGSVQVRDARNTKHLRSFVQLMWAATFAKQLLESGRTSSLRDLYYSSEAFGIDFRNQAESNRIVTDLESLTGMPREEMGIFPDEHSSVYGPVTMRYTVTGYEGREVDLTVSPDGLPIGPALTTAEPVDTDAEIVLAVESGGMFSRLIETRAWEKYHAVLVHLGGQPPRSARRLMRRLHDVLGLPVFVFTDGDPWGMHIARVIVSGSANAAHIDRLTVHDAEWIGVTPADIRDYSLPTDPLTDADLKRLSDLSIDPRYSDPPWCDYIVEFRSLGRKAEQQAFSRYGIDFVVDTYLADKLGQ